MSTWMSIANISLSGRELKEISFDGSTIIGAFQAYDYFGDGSFYLLDVPGHAVGEYLIDYLIRLK